MFTTDWTIFFFCCLLAGAGGALWKPDNWYHGLTKPPTTPPDVLVVIAWVFLYALMAWAGARISNTGNTLAMGLWVGQLMIHAWFTPVFLGKRHLKGAFFVALAYAITTGLLTVILLWVDWLSMFLMGVVFAWAVFATHLAWHIWKDNPQNPSKT